MFLRFLIFGCLSFTLPLFSQWFAKETPFDTIWNEFQSSPNLFSEAYSKNHSPILREEISKDEEFQYYFQLCKFQEIRDLTEILKLVSFYDALLQIKQCSESNAESIKTLEKQTNKRLFDLTVFPKLEILPTEITNEEIFRIVRDLQREWEKTVYLYSNFYKSHEIFFLGKEREYTVTLNRILYSEMPESKRKVLLIRLLQDIRIYQKFIYQLFYYSKQNPWNDSDLSSENENAKLYFLRILSLWKEDSIFSPSQNTLLNELESCLETISTDQTKIRIFGLYGFFSDYGRFSEVKFPQHKKENLTKLEFIRQTLFQSHHFQKRLESVVISCKNSVQFQKEL